MFLLLVMLACGLAPAPTTATSPSPQSCILPAFPVNGSYTIRSRIGVPRPGEEVRRSTELQFSCRSGYFPTGEVSVCLGNNAWSLKSACKKPCTLYGSDTVEFSCYSSQILRIICKPTMLHGSYVNFSCKTKHFLPDTEFLEQMTCIDGSWSKETPECEAECGLENADAGVSPFILKAKIAPKDSLPWHVAVYKEENSEFKYICGGTIISHRLVIGAAHCFYDSNKKLTLPAHLFYVAANKHYQQWNHPDEPNAPKSKVRQIRVHDWYRGIHNQFQNDLALIILETHLEFSNEIAPICWDLGNPRFDNNQLTVGSKGKFAGWGVTEEGRTSDELRVLQVPVIDNQECIIEFKKYNIENHITADKICAGFLNGSTACEGDSGAGLVFSVNTSGQEIWWLRGILSIGPVDKNSGECRNNTYTAYTRLFALRDWLKRQLYLLSSERELLQVTCNLQPSNTVNFLCFDSDNLQTTCPKKVVVGNSIYPLCKEGHVGVGNLAAMSCQQDGWDKPIPNCILSPRNISIGSGLDGFKCALPSYPAHGKFQVEGPNKNLLPGTVVTEFSFITYSCDTDNDTSTTNVQATCVRGNWDSPPPICRIPGSTCLPLPKNAATAQKTGQKAWDKCIELAESVYPCDQSTGRRRYSCAHVAAPLIIGGVEAARGEFPHMAHIGSNTGENNTIDWLCGGTLISERWVLTLARCINYFQKLGFEGYVRLGGTDVNRGKPEDTYRIIQTVVHPDSRRSTVYNDIALAKLDRDVKFTELVRPACLHTGGSVADNKATATGWGVTSVLGNSSKQLLKVTLEKFPFDECSEVNPPSPIFKNGLDNSTQICYGHHSERKDICQGDSGGPVQIYNGKEVECTYLVIGLGSFGKACGEPGFPSVYMRVSAYIPWIESIVWPDIDNINE